VAATLMQALNLRLQRVGAGGLVMHVRPETLVLHIEHCIPLDPVNNNHGVLLAIRRISLMSLSVPYRLGSKVSAREPNTPTLTLPCEMLLPKS